MIDRGRREAVVRLNAWARAPFLEPGDPPPDMTSWTLQLSDNISIKWPTVPNLASMAVIHSDHLSPILPSAFLVPPTLSLRPVPSGGELTISEFAFPR